MKIYLAGNSLVDFDSLPLRIAGRLREELPEIDFEEIDPTEEIDEDIVIIDTVINADDVRLIEGVDNIQLSKVYSMHDFDLGYTLKLLSKLGKLKRVRIICVPPDVDEEEAVRKIKPIASSL